MFDFAKGIIPNGSLHPSWSKSRKVLRRESSQPLERSRSFPVGWPCSRNCLAILRRLPLTSVPEWLSGVSRERVSFRHAPQSVRARVCDGHVLACAFAPALDALPLPCPVMCLFLCMRMFRLLFGCCVLGARAMFVLWLLRVSLCDCAR